jgi:hypothetical protein
MKKKRRSKKIGVTEKGFFVALSGVLKSGDATHPVHQVL